jgi:hypothetical protein
MQDNSVKFEVQTEGLGEFWGVAPNYRERRDREPMTIEAITEVIQTILEESGEEASGLFILEYAKKYLHIKIDGTTVELSRPNDANYQNIAVDPEDLQSSILDFFKIERESGDESKKSHVLLVEWIVLVLAGATMLGAFYFALSFIERDKAFMAEPDYIEVSNKDDLHEHLRELSGIYLTDLQDGETAIRLETDGRWAFYDLKQESRDRFIPELVEQGQCRPVYQKGKLAILTDNNYLFYWESKGVLRFQDRPYVLSAKTASEVSSVEFPE